MRSANAVAPQRVERDVDPAQPGGGEVVGDAGARVTPLVVSDRSTPRAASLRDEHRQVGPHRRLAAGEADESKPKPLDEQPGEALDLLEGEQRRARSSHSMPSSGMQ